MLNQITFKSRKASSLVPLAAGLFALQQYQKKQNECGGILAYVNNDSAS